MRRIYIPREAPVSIMTISFDSLILTFRVCVTEKFGARVDMLLEARCVASY
jgi:hypothetical protein